MMLSNRDRSALVCCALLVCCGGTVNAGETAAEAIIKVSGVKAGLCVHLGATDGKLTAELSAGGKFMVHGLAADAGSVAKARKYIQSKGVYGKVSVERSALKKLPYAENLVNLIVAEDLPALLGNGLDLKEVARVLTPKGALCFKGTVDAGKLKAAGLGAAKTSGAWSVAVKPWPKGMDDWPSFNHGPDMNPVSQDLLVGPPTRLRWRLGLSWGRSNPIVNRIWLSAGGRLFYRVVDFAYGHRATGTTIVARDAHNGLLLWKLPVAMSLRSKYGQNAGASADRLYLPIDKSGILVAVDAATGKVVRRYTEAGPVRGFLYHDGKLYMSGKAVDAETGKILWKQPRGSTAGVGLIAEGRGYGIADDYGDKKARYKLVCLDLATGKVIWRVPIGARAYWYNAPFYYKGAVIITQTVPNKERKVRLRVIAHSPKDGRRLWSYDPEDVKNLFKGGGCYAAQVYGAQGLVWMHAYLAKPDPARKNAGKSPSAWIGLDPATGEVKKRYDDATSDAAVARMLGAGIHRCNKGRATERFCLYGTYDLFDWKTGKYHTSNATRSACTVGMLPANGLIYTPPYTCTCRSYMQNGFMAMAHQPGGLKEAGGSRLEPGPVAGSAGGGASGASADDWPTYRSDPGRTGAGTRAVPASLKQLWASEIGRGLTAPTIAGGSAFVGSMDEHRVWALDAATGKVRWSYTAGGPIDTPPTISGGLAVFGCRDGWVYCLRAADGKLVWRFRAAPAEERIMVDGRLESAWPVHGSVLVLGENAYFAAGWHSNLDGGISLYALKLRSGQLLWKKRLEKLPGHFQKTNRRAALLTSDGKALFMGRWTFNLKNGEILTRHRRAGLVMDFGTSGLLDNNWFQNRKGRWQWSDGRLRAKMITSGKEYSCGIHPFFGRGAPRIGMRDFTLQGLRAGRGAKAWVVKVPVLMRAMAMAGETVFVAGQVDPDISDVLKAEKDLKRIAALVAQIPKERMNPKDARLVAFSVVDGKKLGESKLDSPPVFDGLAAAGGKLYVSCQDGKLRCFGKK